MAYTIGTATNPGTRIADSVTNTTAQVVCNRDGTSIGGSGTGANEVQGTAADGTTAVGNPVQVGGVAVDPASMPSSYVVGDEVALPCDVNTGAQLISTRLLTAADVVTNVPAASSTASTTAYAASLVVKASAGRLFSVNGYNSKASTQFIQVHDAASLPSNSAVPLAILTVPATSNFSIDFGALGIPLSTGIVLAASSTGPTLTVDTSSDVWFQASYL
jgi:hypothetical protein